MSNVRSQDSTSSEAEFCFCRFCNTVILKQTFLYYQQCWKSVFFCILVSAITTPTGTGTQKQMTKFIRINCLWRQHILWRKHIMDAEWHSGVTKECEKSTCLNSAQSKTANQATAPGILWTAVSAVKKHQSKTNDNCIVIDILTWWDRLLACLCKLSFNLPGCLHLSWMNIQRACFSFVLQNIFNNHMLDVNVRWLAVLYFKNGIDRYWRRVAPQ